MFLRQVFDPYLAQYAYIVGCQKTGEAIVIDPLRDIDGYMKIAAENDLRISAVAETHIHADFVSGARELAEDPAIHLYLSGEGGEDWSYRWTGDRAATTLLGDGAVFHVGNIEFTAIHSPGHTPEHISYLIRDSGGGAGEPIALASGDFLFVGDVGRPDLLESAAGLQGSMRPAAQTLGSSLRRALGDLAEYVQVLPAHGAGSACGKSLGAVPTSTLGYERRFNHALKLANQSADGFVDFILSGQPEPPPYFARMKTVNRDGIAVTHGVPGAKRLAPADFARVAGGGRIIDASTDSDAFSKAHYVGSLFAPLRSPYFSVAAGSYIEAEDTIFLILEDEADLDCARRQLYRIGYDNYGGWITRAELAKAGLLDGRLHRREFGSFDAVAVGQAGHMLDVRTSAEFDEGHIEGAVSIPYTRLRLRLEDLPEIDGDPLHIHCGSGKRAALAAAYLQSLGHSVVYVDGICEDCEKIAAAQGVLS